jgi:hypothetical protein
MGDLPNVRAYLDDILVMPVPLRTAYGMFNWYCNVYQMQDLL